MRSQVFLAATLLVAASLSAANSEQQRQQQQVGARILRRVIKSTPTASNLGRVRLVTVRSSGSGPALERGAVSEISSREAATFGQRSANETVSPATSVKSTSGQHQQQSKSAPRQVGAASTPSTTTTSTSTAAPSTSAPSTQSSVATQSSTTSAPKRASERQQAAPEATVEVLAGSPSSWQVMSAVEAPATAALIAAGTRPASSDLSSASSEHESTSSSASEFMRSSSSVSHSVKGGQLTNSIGETFSRLRAGTKSGQQQQAYFYPQQQQQRGKTSNYQATKTHWYQPSTTTPRPAPIVQQPQYEQYVEQQQVVEAAPPGQAEPFAFDFNTQDNSGNGQYRKEESDSNGVVRGSYGYTDANGIYRHVEYVADQNGFRANIKSNEPGLHGETQPASISLTGGPSQQPPAQPALSSEAAPAAPSSQRFSAEPAEWTGASSSSERADLVAAAPPDFESSHKSERIRAPRNSYRF